MIIGYFVIIFFLALYNNKNKDENEFLFASRKITIPSFVATIVTTWYGGILAVGEATYNQGIITWIMFCFFYYFSAFIFGFYIGPRIHNKNIYSLPEYFHLKLGNIAGSISSILIYLIGSPVPYIIVFATIISHVYDIGYFTSVVLGITVSTLYIHIGGLKSVIRTDKLQFILMYIGFSIILYKLITGYGGYEYLINNVPESNLSFNIKGNAGLLLSWFFISLITMIDPSIYQRTYSAKNIKTIKKGFIISIIFWFIFDVMTISTGLYASAIITTDIYDKTSSPYLQLANIILPNYYLNTIFLISLLAIVMSTIDSTTFISSITFNDFYKKIFKRKYKKNINYGLIVTSITSIGLCFYFNEAIGYWYVFGTIASCTLLIPFIITLYLDNYTLKNPGITLIFPLVITIYFIINQNIYVNTLYPIFPGMLSSILINLLNLSKIKIL